MELSVCTLMRTPRGLCIYSSLSASFGFDKRIEMPARDTYAVAPVLGGSWRRPAGVSWRILAHLSASVLKRGRPGG